MKLFLESLFVIISLSNCFALKCDFRYEEDDANYPEHVIDELIERSFAIETRIETTVENSKEFICEDDLDDNGTSFNDFIKNRISETPSEEDLDAESLCHTAKKIIRPKAMPSVRNNDLLTVINHGEFSQTVTIEECEMANTPCMFDQNFPLGYGTKCKQKHQTHTIKVLNADQTAVIDEAIYYPSGCECKVFKMKSIMSRI